MAWFTEFRLEGENEPHMVCFFSTLRYRLADAVALVIEQEAAWCGQCREFVSAEHLPSVEELHNRIRSLQSPTKIHYFIFGADSGIKQAIDELRHRLAWRQTRIAPAHCLNQVRFNGDRTDSFW